MSNRLQTLALQLSIILLATAALSYCSLLLFTVLVSRGVTFKDFDFAAWTQAVGSIVAILVAVFVSRRGFRHAEQLRNDEAAAGVFLRSSLISSIATLGQVALQVVYEHPSDPQVAGDRREMMSEHWKRLHLVQAQILETVESMNQFPVASMTSGEELIIWNIARDRARIFAEVSKHIGGSDPEMKSRVHTEVRDLQNMAKRLVKVAHDVANGTRSATVMGV